MATEYGVAHRDDKLTGQVHRSGMTKQEAEQWVKDWESDGGLKGAFYVVEREIPVWRASA